jgi:hypothetical protein
VSELNVTLVDAVLLNFTVVTPVKPAGDGDVRPHRAALAERGDRRRVTAATSDGEARRARAGPFGVETPIDWSARLSARWRELGVRVDAERRRPTPPKVTPVAPEACARHVDVRADGPLRA